jgi:nicotinate-nucleotide adenylyltransferase
VAAIERKVPAARGRIEIIRSLGLEISATNIRERIRTGRTVRYLLPGPVLAYIEAHGLYRDSAG